MTKQEWRMQLQAEQEALLQALGTLLEKGLPEHTKRLEEFQLAASQLSAAVAAGATAERIADQEDRLHALYTELSVAAEGLPRYKELLSAIRERERLLKDGTLGLQHCSVEPHCSLPDDKKYSGHVPLRHRPCQLQGSRMPALAPPMDSF
ncbi:g1030 [Coccomyxa viridis]|uniref:G1030 protein n=1 Tax=Coccomyxa viridis TaxID=1274662 RepID=A0ABP1FIQ9_9CHLO